MSLRFACVKCGQHISAEQSAAGTVANCPSCNEPLVVPMDPTLNETRSEIRRARWKPITIRVAVYLFVIVLLACVGTYITGRKSRLTISDVFRTQLMRFVEQSQRISVSVSHGVSYRDLKNQVIDAESTYRILSASWPNNFAPDAGVEIEKAIEGWRLALELWSLEIEEESITGGRLYPGLHDSLCPPESDELYRQLLAYAGESLSIRVRPDDYYREEERGKKYVAYSSRQMLLSKANEHLNRGTNIVLLDLSKR